MRIPHAVAHLVPDRRYKYVPVKPRPYPRHRDHISGLHTGKTRAFAPAADLRQQTSLLLRIHPCLELRPGQIAAVMKFITRWARDSRQIGTLDIPLLRPTC